ncbi:MAG: peptidoglycan-binding protein [Oscillospiraceae bacterium]|nr:peptidoglycan-binding protein [Oscillospiraceae bacterium]
MNDIIKKALDWALETAKDNAHGYSQAVRWGPDYDCSSFIISAYENAGLKVKEAGASYTGNLRDAFEKCGFGAYPRQPVSKLEPGDVLLNERHHAAMYIGDGKVAAARSSDGFPLSGDQSGREICVQNYYDYPWDCVLRYAPQVNSVQSTEYSGQSTVNSGQGTVDCDVALPVLKKGDKGTAVKIMQELLIAGGFNCGPDGADGDFGPNTAKALKSFQTARELCADTVCGKETWEELIKI